MYCRILDVYLSDLVERGCFATRIVSSINEPVSLSRTCSLFLLAYGTIGIGKPTIGSSVEFLRGIRLALTIVTSMPFRNPIQNTLAQLTSPSKHNHLVPLTSSIAVPVCSTFQKKLHGKLLFFIFHPYVLTVFAAYKRQLKMMTKNGSRNFC